MPAPSTSSTSNSASPTSSVHDLPPMTPTPAHYVPQFYHHHHHPPPPLEPYRVMPMHVHDYHPFQGNGTTIHPGHNGSSSLFTRTYLPPPVTTSYRAPPPLPPPPPMSAIPPISSSGLHLDSGHHHHSHPEIPLDPILMPLSRLPPLDHLHHTQQQQQQQQHHHHHHQHHQHHHHHPLSPMLEPQSSTGSENEHSDSH